MEGAYDCVVEGECDTMVEGQYDSIVEGQYDTIKELEDYPWYVGMKSRLEAERALFKFKSGTFLVRESIDRPGEYAIAIK